MPDYKALYLRLFAAQADAIDALTDTSNMLIQVHREMEDMVMNAPEPNIVGIRQKGEDDHEDD